MISVLICDDSPIVRMGLRLVLESEEDIQVTGEFAGGAEAVDAAARLRPDVVLLDVQMPGMDGIEATRRILRTPSAPRVLILTTFDLDEYVHEALRAGASGFLIKDTPPERVVDAVRSVAAGDAALSPSVARRLLDTVATSLPRGTVGGPLRELSTSELELLRLVATGKTNGEIADELELTRSTVKSYVSRLFARIGARDRTHAVILAYECGLVR